MSKSDPLHMFVDRFDRGLFDIQFVGFIFGCSKCSWIGLYSRSGSPVRVILGGSALPNLDPDRDLGLSLLSICLCARSGLRFSYPIILCSIGFPIGRGARLVLLPD